MYPYLAGGSEEYWDGVIKQLVAKHKEFYLKVPHDWGGMLFVQEGANG